MSRPPAIEIALSLSIVAKVWGIGRYDAQQQPKRITKHRPRKVPCDLDGAETHQSNHLEDSAGGESRGARVVLGAGCHDARPVRGGPFRQRTHWLQEFAADSG